MDFDTDWGSLTPEEKDQRIEAAVAHDIAILEEQWAEMGPPPPTVEDHIDQAGANIQASVERLERRLIVCCVACWLGAMLTVILLLKR